MKTLDQREGKWGEVGSQSLACPSREPDYGGHGRVLKMKN